MTAGHEQLRWEGERAVFAMPPELDITNADQIRHGLRAAASLGPPVLIIDMSATTFCDSSGVQAIVDAYNQVHSHNQGAATRTQLRLVATTVRRILTLVGVDQLMPVYSTLEAALADPADSSDQNARSGDRPAE
jgi:anti-sigma B factor antagonist